MSSSHRPTFNPAKGKESNAPTMQYSSRDLAAHTSLKFRRTGQGSTGEISKRDLRAELLAAELTYYEKKRRLEDGIDYVPRPTEAPALIEDVNEDEEAEKRRRILEQAKELDKDDSDDEEDKSDDDDDSEDDADETAALMRELEKIKRERAEEKAKQELEEQDEREKLRQEEILTNNPLLNLQARVNGDNADFGVKRRWDDDVVFKHQARQTKPEKRFINDVLRSDFHRKFMSKYIR